MKKLLTGLACCAMVLVGGVSLAACCGNDSLVDTSGNYAPATYAQVEEAMAGINQDQTISAYEFRVTMEGSYEGQTMDVNVSGVIDANGNLSMSSDMYMKVSGGGTNFEANVNGDIYYQVATDGSSTSTWYVRNGDEKIKYTDSEIENSPFAMIYSMATSVNLDLAMDPFDSESSDATYKISTSGGYTKLQTVEIVTTAEEVEVTNTAYFVMDGEGNFVGCVMTMESDVGANLTMEFKTSNDTVEFPSDLDSYTEAA